MIDFAKYLRCPACKSCGLYCPAHRTDVEKILDEENNEGAY